jgi:replicative DNA helicase
MTTLSRLNQYGNAFQVKVLGALLTQRDFLLNIADALDSEYFESSAHKWIIEYIIKYFGQYHTYPTIETLSIEIKKIDNEVLRISLTDSLREAYKMADVADLEWVEKEFSDFCKNQQMKKAIMTSVDLLNLGDYDGIRGLINDAMKAGEEKNIGHIYEADVEARYRDDDRRAIPFPWKTFNDLTQGGYGKGDLVLLFGNPGGGKSWGVIAMAAYAAALGYNVVHYTLELSEGYVGKRYDAVFSGIDVDKLDQHRVEVEEAIGKVKGKIVIKEYAPKRASLDTIESHLQQLEHQNQFKPDLIIIDYLDLLRTKGRKERKDEIDDVYTDAKGMAKELGIPVVSPSQANRSGADKGILQAENAAGSYDKIMIGDIIISLARGRKDKVNGTGNWHFIKNRYGVDGLTFGSKINTAHGYIDIYDQPMDDDDTTEIKGKNKAVNSFSEVGVEDKYVLRSKFLKYEEEA